MPASVLIGRGIFRVAPAPLFTPGALSHPDYVFSYLGDSQFYVGDLPPLKWQLSRKDGTAPATPISAVVHVWDSTGNLIATLTPDLDPAPPAGSIVLAALWPVGPAAAYAIMLTVTMPGDGQIRSDKEMVLVR